MHEGELQPKLQPLWVDDRLGAWTFDSHSQPGGIG
jgi:hypothetical protein